MSCTSAEGQHQVSSSPLPITAVLPAFVLFFVAIELCRGVSWLTCAIGSHVHSMDRCCCISTNYIMDACINLCTCRCILRALVVLHQAGFAHTDLRWENIILQRAGMWVLIDLEFACVLDTLPFTPNSKLTYKLHFLCALHVHSHFHIGACSKNKS